MRPLHIAFIYFSHLLSLAVTVYTARANGVRVEVLLYAFLIDYVMRLYTIALLQSAVTARRQGWLSGIAPYVTRLPAPGQESYPIRDDQTGRPMGFGTYLIAIAMCSALAFVLANVNADREIALTSEDALRDFGWASAFATLYWVNSLLTRTMTIHPRQSIARNLGYNSKELTVLALAVLVGGLVVVVRQANGMDQSAWAVMGPLLGFRMWYDLWASLDALPSTDPSP